MSVATQSVAIDLNLYQQIQALQKDVSSIQENHKMVDEVEAKIDAWIKSSPLFTVKEGLEEAQRRVTDLKRRITAYENEDATNTATATATAVANVKTPASRDIRLALLGIKTRINHVFALAYPGMRTKLCPYKEADYLVLVEKWNEFKKAGSSLAKGVDVETPLAALRETIISKNIDVDQSAQDLRLFYEVCKIRNLAAITLFYDAGANLNADIPDPRDKIVGLNTIEGDSPLLTLLECEYSQFLSNRRNLPPIFDFFKFRGVKVNQTIVYGDQRGSIAFRLNRVSFQAVDCLFKAGLDLNPIGEKPPLSKLIHSLPWEMEWTRHINSARIFQLVFMGARPSFDDISFRFDHNLDNQQVVQINAMYNSIMTRWVPSACFVEGGWQPPLLSTMYRFDYVNSFAFDAKLAWTLISPVKDWIEIPIAIHNFIVEAYGDVHTRIEKVEFLLKKVIPSMSTSLISLIANYEYYSLLIPAESEELLQQVMHLLANLSLRSKASLSPMITPSAAV